MIRKTLFGALAAFGLAIVGLGFGSQSASAEVVANMKGAAPHVVYDNPCEPGINPISFDGRYHYVWYTTPEGHTIMRYNLHFVGTDTNGTEYIFNFQRTMDHQDWPVMVPYSDVIVRRFISKGAGDNATITMTIAWATTIPPAPADVVTTITCRG